MQTKGRTRIEIVAKTASNLKVTKGIDVTYCYTCLTKLYEEQPCVWVCDLFFCSIKQNQRAAPPLGLVRDPKGENFKVPTASFTNAHALKSMSVCLYVCMSHNQIIRLEDEKVNFKENLFLINK